MLKSPNVAFLQPDPPMMLPCSLFDLLLASHRHPLELLGLILGHPGRTLARFAHLLGQFWRHFGYFLEVLGLVPQRVAKELPRPSQRPKLTQNGASRSQNRPQRNISGGLFNRRSSTDLLLGQVRKCFQNGSPSGQDCFGMI